MYPPHRHFLEAATVPLIPADRSLGCSATSRARVAIAAAVLLAAASASGAGPIPIPIPGPARPEPERASEASPDVPLVPKAIPFEQVFREADEIEGPLRRAEAAAAVDPSVEGVERRLTATESAAERLRPAVEPARLAEASAREIDRLRQALSREDALLADGQGVLEKRSELLALSTHELKTRLTSWQLTAEAARRERAPAVVLRRAAQVEEALRGEEARLRARQEQLLGIQGRASDLRAELARAAAAVDAADASLKQQLFEVESAPLWRALSAPERAGALGGQVRQALRESSRDLSSFLKEERTTLALHLAVVLILALGFAALRRPVTALAAEDPALRGAVQVLARPGSAAWLLSLPLMSGLYPPFPPAVQDVFFLTMLVPLLRLLPDLLPDAFRRPLVGLMALFALDRLASFAPPRTLLARLAVLLVAAVALVELVRGLRRGGWGRFLRPGGWGHATRAAVVAALALLAVSVVSNVLGNATLAERLVHATLASATLAIALLGLQVVLEGALAALLHLPALERRALVAHHRTLLLRRAATLLRAASVAFWATRTLVELRIAEGVWGALSGALGLRLQVGGLDVSLGNIAAFGVTLALTLGVARAVRFLLDEGLFAEFDLPRGVPTAVSSTVQYTLLLLGFSWAVLASGMEMSRFSFLVGALGVGVGFGLQNVVNNLVSGLILLYERPVQVRDVVQVGAVTGEVTRIGVRSTTVRTFDGAEVIVPNATLISTEVTNWTLSDRRRRIELSVGVAYGSSPRQVLELLLAAVNGRAGVLEDPAPVAIFLRFGESSIDFVLRFWTADFDRWQALASDVTVEVYEALGRAGIPIPFPQRDLHVRSVDPGAAETLRGAGPAPR